MISMISRAACVILAVGIASAASRGAAAAPHAAPAAGDWIYDAQGDVVGSLTRLTDGGREAVLMIGAYFQPGSHQVVVPATALTVVDGQTTLAPKTVEASNVRPAK